MKHSLSSLSWSARALAGASTLLAISAGSISHAGAPDADAGTNHRTQIEKAVDDLAHEQFRVREKATRFLWEQGKRAESALAEATASDDPEVALRAKEILEKVRAGILPDVPKEFMPIVRQYYAGTEREKGESLQMLLTKPKHGIRIAARLLGSEENEGTRRRLFQRLGDSYYKAIRSLLAEGEIEDARLLLTEATTSGTDKACRYFTAFVLEQGDIEKEIKSRTKQREKNASDWRMLTYLHRANADPQSAIAAATHVDDVSLLRSALQEAGDWKRLAELIAKGPETSDIEWLGFRAAYNRLAGNTNAFQKAISDIETFGRSKTDVAPYAAEALLLNDCPEKALKLLTATKNYAGAARLLRSQLRFDDMLTLLEKAEEDSSSELPALYELVAPILVKKQDQIGREPAPGPPRRVAALTPYRRWLAKGDELAEGENWKEAAESYRWAVKEAPDAPLAMYLQGRALAHAGQEKEGRQIMDRVTLMLLGDERTRFRLAVSLQDRDLPEDANRQYKWILRTAPFESWYLGEAFRRYAVRQCMEKKDYQGAVLYAEQDRLQCLRTHTATANVEGYLVQSCRVATFLSLAFLSQGHTEKGLEAVKRCMRMLPDAHMELYPLLDRIGKKEIANASFEKSFEVLAAVCKKYPNIGFVHNNIAWLAARARRRLKEGLKHAQQAVTLEPHSHQFIDTLAEVYFQLGRRMEAMKMMQRCIELDPDTPYYRRQLKRFEAGDPTTDPSEPY